MVAADSVARHARLERRTLPAMNMAENVATFSTAKSPSTTRRVWSAAWPSSSSPFRRRLPETTSGRGPRASASEDALLAAWRQGKLFKAKK